MTCEEEEGGGKMVVMERKEAEEELQPHAPAALSLPTASHAREPQPQPPPQQPLMPAATVHLAAPSTPPPPNPSSAYAAATGVYDIYSHRLQHFYPPAAPSPYNAYPAFYPLYPKQPPYHSASHSPAAAAASPHSASHSSQAGERQSVHAKSKKSRRTLNGAAGGEEDDSDSSDDSDDEEEDDDGQPSSRRASLAAAAQQTPPAELAGAADAAQSQLHESPIHAVRVPAAQRIPTVAAEQSVYPPPPAQHFAAALPGYHPYYQQAVMTRATPAAHTVTQPRTLRTPHISPLLQPLASGAAEAGVGSMAHEQCEVEAGPGELYTLPTATSVHQHHLLHQQQQQYVYQHRPHLYQQPQRLEHFQQPPLPAVPPFRQPNIGATVQPVDVQSLAAQSTAIRSPPTLHPSPQQQQLHAATSPSHQPLQQQQQQQPHAATELYQAGLQSPQSAHSLSVSRTTQASPLSATSDVPDDAYESAQLASLPTYSSAYQHIHNAHGLTRSVDDFHVHLSNHTQAEVDVHRQQQQQQLAQTYQQQQQQQQYQYGHTRTASDDLTYTLHSVQHAMQQQQGQPYDDLSGYGVECAGGDEAVAAAAGPGGTTRLMRSQNVSAHQVAFTDYHGAKGRVFRVRDITSSYAEGDDSRRGSRAGSYTVHASPTPHAHAHYFSDSPQRYAGQPFVDSSISGQPWEYAAADAFPSSHAVPAAPLLSAHPAAPPYLHAVHPQPHPFAHPHAAPFHRVATAPSASSKKTKKVRKDEIHFADLRFGDKIGEGSFGEVFRGSLWGQEVAIKKLRIQHVDGAAVSKEFKKEVKIMRSLRHPNIGVCMEPPNLCLVTEYLSNGSLEDVLTRMNAKEGALSKKFSLKRIISLAKDIARGLNWLHHKGIIHRDLKSANILLDANGKAKICDFGLSHVKRRVDLSGSYGICGTPSYMAPEVLRKQSYGVKADVFSFGICLCELISGKYPYESDNQSTRTFEDAIVAGLRPVIPAYCPLSIKHLVQSCWADSPDERPSVDEVMDTLVLTERQLLAAENLTILDEMPEEIAKLFEDQKAENAFLAMSIKQLKGQLDAAQLRANEWEEKCAVERAAREEAEREVQRLREQLQLQHQLTAGHTAHSGVPSSSSPLLAMAVPVLSRGGSAMALDSSAGSRRLSVVSLASVSRLSSGGSVGGSLSTANLTGTAASPGAVSGSSSVVAGPMYCASRPVVHTAATSPQPPPLVSPSNTPSPTHSHTTSLFSTAQQHQPLYASHSHVPPAGFLSPALSAPLASSSPSPHSLLQQPPAHYRNSQSISRSPSPPSISPRHRQH